MPTSRWSTDSGEWDERGWQISAKEKNIARLHGSSDILMLGYDTAWARKLCHVSRQDGMTCRLWAGHSGQHIPFSGELIAVSGIYVVERM